MTTPRPDNTTTESEAYLARLCARTFLRLWSYPSLYRDQRGRSSGDGKELCDLLVVFENQVLLFSDKHCEFKEAKTLEIAWSRWYRKAVVDAARQLQGAERWLRSAPDRVFLDRSCAHPFPLSLPDGPRFHRIVTCRGAAQGCAELFGGRGSLIVTSSPLDEVIEQPMRLGARAASGEIVHVLDEVALDIVFSTLDTVSDFCRYLAEREEFLAKYHVQAAGEEELLGYYLSKYSDELKKYHFAVPNPDGTSGAPTMVGIDEGFWADWEGSTARKRKLEADRVSYAWDKLIEKFTFHLLAGTQEFTTHRAPAEMEPMLRWMAREPRTRRRMLARTLRDAMRTTPTGDMRRQLILPSSDGDPYWVLLVFPRPVSMDLERYRVVRRELLLALCKIAKHVRPDALDIVGVAVTTNMDEMSEDGLYLDARFWTDELEQQAKDMHDKTGFFASQARSFGVERDIPDDDG